MLRATQEQEWWADQVVHVMLEGKRALDAAMLDVGRLVAETLMYMERSGPDYHPTSSGLRKWASQRGSIYVGDQKLPVEHPRLRGPEGEVGLRTYEQLKNRGGFSEELLSEVEVRRDGDGGRQGFRCDAELGVPPSGRGDGEAAEAVPGAQSRRVSALRDVPRHGPPRRSGVSILRLVISVPFWSINSNALP